MPFYTNKRPDIVGVVRKVALANCAYRSPNLDERQLCDCKYMGSEDKLGDGEHNCGCPNLHQAADMLSALTDKEWERVLKRIRKKDHSMQPTKRGRFNRPVSYATDRLKEGVTVTTITGGVINGHPFVTEITVGPVEKK